MTRYVPVSARLFISVPELGDLDGALGRTHGGRLLPLMAGASSQGAVSLDLRKAALMFLGARTAIDLDELMAAEIGMVAPSWSELGAAVWFVRLPDKVAIDRWFPKPLRSGGDPSSPVPYFRMNTGVFVCVGDGIVALARGRGIELMLRDTIRLMGEKPGDALEQSQVYAQLMGSLEPGPLATVYVANDLSTDQSEGDVGITSPAARFWPQTEQAVIGVYEGVGRIDLSVRAILPLGKSHAGGRLPGDVIDRLLQLPQSTVLAVATAADAGDTLKAAVSEAGTWGRYVKLFSGLRPRKGTDAQVPEATPHVLFVWGQDYAEDRMAPQVAVMIESVDAHHLHDEVTQIAKRVGRLLLALASSHGSEKPVEPIIEHEFHLGTRITYLQRVPQSSRSRLPLARLLSGVEPAWAVCDGWLIMAMGRNHLKRIIGARRGLVPKLGGMRDVRRLKARHPEAGTLCILQGAAAATLFDAWLKAFEDGKPSLLDPSWWNKPPRARAMARWQLGIGMKAKQVPGVVVVARVYPDTPADNRLEPGDRILGVDGELLALHAPNTDLRRRLATSTAAPGPTLRVRRGDVMMKIILERSIEPPAAPDIPIRPADAVRELASLARALELATLQVHAAEVGHYSAHLSLRLATSPSR